MAEGNARIVVIADDAELRDRLAAALEREGQTVYAAAEAGAGARCAVRDDVDLVLLSFGLPAPGAAAVCREIRAGHAGQPIPILAVLPTAPPAGNGALEAEALAAGVDDVLEAPFSDRLLLARVSSGLRAKAGRDRVAQVERDLSAILELTFHLASTLDPAEVLFLVVRGVAELLEVDRAAVVLLNAPRRSARIVAASEDCEIRDLRLQLDKYPEILEVVRTRQPLVIADAENDPILDAVKDEVRRAGVRSLGLFPMDVGGEVLGVLFLRTMGRQATIDSRKQRLAQILTSSIAIALRNAMAFQEARAESTRSEEARTLAERRISSLERYRDFFEGAYDGLAIVDPDGRLLFLNKEIERLAGFERRRILGRTLQELVDPPFAASAAEIVAGAANAQRRSRVDLRLHTSEGREVVVETSATALPGADGAVMLAFRDVTEERALAGELTKTKDFLENLIRSSADAIIAADMDGQVMVFNPKAQAIFGFGADEVIGRLNLKELFPPGAYQEILRLLRSSQHGGEGRLSPARREIVARSGEIVPIMLSAGIVYEGEEEVAIVGIFTDLRERLRIEEKLTQVEEKLAVSERQAVLAELAGTAAHELNQPLTSVMGYAEMIRRKLPEGDERIRRAVDTILSESERMAEIVRKIGKITKYETAPYVGSTRIVDLDRSSDSGAR